MSSVISNKVQSYVFSSNPALGATNISADGSSFSVSLDSPIEVPRGVIDCTLDVIAASIWNVSPNIKAAYNNDKFYFSHLGTPYIITIETGLYSLPQLNSYFRRYFVNNGLPNNLIVLSANDSAQTCIITFNYVGTQIDFTQLNTVRTILGFNSELLPNGGPSTIIGESYEGESKASFNRINFYYFKSSLVNQGWHKWKYYRTSANNSVSRKPNQLSTSEYYINSSTWANRQSSTTDNFSVIG